MDRRAVVDVAMGRRSADVIVAGGKLVDVYTGEIRQADVAIAEGRVARVGNVASCRGERSA